MFLERDTCSYDFFLTLSILSPTKVLTFPPESPCIKNLGDTGAVNQKGFTYYSATLTPTYISCTVRSFAPFAQQ